MIGSDLSGERFSRLLVKSRADRTEKSRAAAFLCVCDCGTEIVTRRDRLLAGRAKSCGCLRIDSARKQRNRLVHGHSSDGKLTPEYATWCHIQQRCDNSNHKDYANYGGRGIAVCDRWRHGENGKHGFECFLSDMGKRPIRLSIDRIDVNGDYEPNNCRWATAYVQRINQRPRTRESFIRKVFLSRRESSP